MKTADFSYFLPSGLIAQTPLPQRDASRLLILKRESGAIRHSRFYALGEELRSGDVLVLNESKVFPARLRSFKQSGAKIELLLLKPNGNKSWQALIRPARKAPLGTKLYFEVENVSARVSAYGDDGIRVVDFDYEGDFRVFLEKAGEMPLPPYIKEELRDQNRYQPIYATCRGSAAAPTAGLHFTAELLKTLTQKGVILAKVLLHVGLATFRPVKTENVEAHTMHKEFYRLNAENAAIINAAHGKGGRVIAVGTTSVRVLETLADEKGVISPGEGWTDKYIYPGYNFRVTDAIISNFHLPESTLLMLISAFAGRENTLNAYNEAIKEKYRFFSFGDAMLIV